MEQLVPAQNNKQAPAQQKQPPNQSNPETELIKDLTIGLPSPVKLLQESLLLLRKKILSFFIVIAVAILPLYGISKLPLFLNLQSPITSFIFNFIFLYITIFVSSFMLLALLFAVKDNEENITVLKAYKLAGKHFLEYWKILLLIFVILFIGKLFFIIPSVILSVWFSISLMVYLVEDLKGMDALLMSKQYIQGYWSSVFLRLVFLTVIIGLICFPLVLIWPTSQTNYFFDLYLLLISFFILPIVTIYLFLIYGNLRLLKPNNSELIEALHKTSDTKIKLKLLKPAFLEGMIIGIPLVLILIYLFVFRIYKVTGNSMAPNFNDDQLITASFLNYNSDLIEREDVIVFHSPVNPKKALIKRVIGLPYESFGIINGEIYINGIKLDESKYLENTVKTQGAEFLKDNYTFKIPNDNYIVLGDNRSDSDDSRDWGLIRDSDIIGKVGRCLWNCPKDINSK